MQISARVQNSSGEHHATVTTNDVTRPIAIPPKASGFGSSANGGELLFLALATCYCNDIYREAAKRGITVTRVEVDVDGQFGAPGEPAWRVTYRARVVADASEAEIQNTLRTPTEVTLSQVEAINVQP